MEISNISPEVLKQLESTCHETNTDLAFALDCIDLIYKKCFEAALLAEA